MPNRHPNFMYRKLIICRISVLAVSVLAIPLIALGQTDSQLTWPAGQVLPHFPSPAKSIDVLTLQSCSSDEQLTLVALQGQANRISPRIWLKNTRSEEGSNTWFRTLDLQVGTDYNSGNWLQLVEKYADEIRGVVLYDVVHSSHMRNLAATSAGLHKALPVTPDIYARLVEQGVQLPVLEDLTKLKLLTALEVYEHLYANYWADCEKRFLLSARPNGRKGDYHHTRDLAAACGAASVWLDCRIAAERDLLSKFLADMPTGNAVVLGWYTSERSGVTTATEYGIGTMPADYFMNATIFAGREHNIHNPPTSPLPKLEDKLYITILLSDGDNIQYAQHALRRIWDRSSATRGKMPLNWTIAPGLVDIAPDILNYYYSSASPKDCFVCGPSGMGYTIPVNTLEEPGARLGNILTDESRMELYMTLTSKYLRRAGLRTLTVWDNASPMHRAAYERSCPDLLGVTVQNFKDDPTVESSVTNNRLRFERLEIPYASSYRHLRKSVERWVERQDGKNPLFVAYQANIWSELQPERLVEFMLEMQDSHPQIEFLRADHYFQLQDKARRDLK